MYEIVSMGSGSLCLISIDGDPVFPCCHISPSVRLLGIVHWNVLIHIGVLIHAQSWSLSRFLWWPITSPLRSQIFLVCNVVLNDLLVVVFPLSYCPDWVVHILTGMSISLLSCGCPLSHLSIPSVMSGMTLCPSLCFLDVLIQTVYSLLPIISWSMLQWIFQFLSPSYSTHQILWQELRSLWLLLCHLFTQGSALDGESVPLVPCLWDLLGYFFLEFCLWCRMCVFVRY